MSARARGEPDEDIALVRFVLNQLEPGEVMKLHANGSWRIDEALRVTEHIDERVILEQHCES